MGKPFGIAMLTNGTMMVRPSDRVSDQIWDAVREAINANITPDQFKREAAQAWEHHLSEDAKHAVRTLCK